MLILSRKSGERIQIGEDVCITVVRVGQGGVRIGVDAPEGYSIARSEIQQEHPPKKKSPEREALSAELSDDDLLNPR